MAPDVQAQLDRIIQELSAIRKAVVKPPQKKPEPATVKGTFREVWRQLKDFWKMRTRYQIGLRTLTAAYCRVLCFGMDNILGFDSRNSRW